MLLVFVGSPLVWVANVPHLCTPVIDSRLSVLHVLIVRPTVQLDVTFITCRIQHTVTFTLFSTALIQLRSDGSSSLGPVFHAHSSCRQKVELLQSNVTRFLCSLPSSTLLIASTSMGLYLIGAAAPDGTFTNRLSTYTFPCLSERRFLLPLPVHDVRPILSDEQVVPSMDDVGG